MDTDHIRDSIARVTQYLTEQPEKGLVTDKAAVCTWQGGLLCRAEGPHGAVLVTDMPKGVGGAATAPTPGWFLRAAVGNCATTVMAMRAAQLGVSLNRLAVTVDSVSDDRGLFGLGDNVPPGPQSMRMRVEIAASNASVEQLRDIVAWAEAHAPVSDAIRRAVPLSVEIVVSRFGFQAR